MNLKIDVSWMLDNSKNNNKRLVTSCYDVDWINISKKEKYINSFVVFDFETTGLDPVEHEIIQIGAIKYINGIETERFESYIKPQNPIPEFISNLTDIYNRDVENAPDIIDVLPKFVEFIEDHILVAHNVSFDMSFLQTNLNYIGMDIVKNNVADTWDLARRFLSLDNYKLETIKNHYNMNLSSHNSISDCLVCAKIYLDYIDFINPVYDNITDEIFKCFIDPSGGKIPANLIKKLEKICLDNNGKLYRSAVKSAKFAIIANDWYKNSKRITFWNEKGFKVTSIDCLEEYLNLKLVSDSIKLKLL